MSHIFLLGLKVRTLQTNKNVWISWNPETYSSMECNYAVVVLKRKGIKITLIMKILDKMPHLIIQNVKIYKLFYIRDDICEKVSIHSKKNISKTSNIQPSLEPNLASQDEITSTGHRYVRRYMLFKKTQTPHCIPSVSYCPSLVISGPIKTGSFIWMNEKLHDASDYFQM